MLDPHAQGAQPAEPYAATETLPERGNARAKAAGVKFLTTRAPFTLVTSTILRDDAVPGDFVGNYVINAQTRDGSLYTETRFLLNRTSPKFVMKTFTSATGTTRTIFWSEDREALGNLVWLRLHLPPRRGFRRRKPDV